jgi:hypothetical protein
VAKSTINGSFQIFVAQNSGIPKEKNGQFYNCKEIFHKCGKKPHNSLFSKIGTLRNDGPNG